MNWFEWLYWIGGTLAILAIVALIIVSNRRAQAYIDRLPVTTAPARIVAKRAQTFGFGRVDYYATFELPSGQRLEFMIVEGYGLLVEGDEGELTYHVMERGGSVFKGFRRVGPSRNAPEGKGEGKGTS
jgi:hypothetical protein